MIIRTASKHEIKTAYRKLAMALHPDRHDGCEIKAEEFKQATEAYATLSDYDKRKIYDNEFYHPGGGNKNRRKPPPANYRKVYAPRAPPGFKTFNAQRHYDMHYGNGIMEEEIKRARMRAEAASTRRNQGYDYVSPLGKGFTFSSIGDKSSNTNNIDRNPYSKRSPQGPPSSSTGEIRFEYEEAQIFGLNGLRDDSVHNRKAKDTVKSRLESRRKERRRNRGDPSVSSQHEEDSSCTIM